MYQDFNSFYGCITFSTISIRVNIVWKDHILFIHSSDDGDLFFPHLLALVNGAVMNVCVQVFEHLFSILLGIYLGEELLCHMATLISYLKKQTHVHFSTEIIIVGIYSREVTVMLPDNYLLGY